MVLNFLYFLYLIFKNILLYRFNEYICNNLNILNEV